MIGLPVEQKLQGQVNHDHHGGHNDRSDDEFARERKSSQRRAQSVLRARRKPDLHRENGQGETSRTL